MHVGGEPKRDSLENVPLTQFQSADSESASLESLEPLPSPKSQGEVAHSTDINAQPILKALGKEAKQIQKELDKAIQGFKTLQAPIKSYFRLITWVREKLFERTLAQQLQATKKFETLQGRIQRLDQHDRAALSQKANFARELSLGLNNVSQAMNAATPFKALKNICDALLIHQQLQAESPDLANSLISSIQYARDKQHLGVLTEAQTQAFASKEYTKDLVNAYKFHALLFPEDNHATLDAIRTMEQALGSDKSEFQPNKAFLQKHPSFKAQAEEKAKVAEQPKVMLSQKAQAEIKNIEEEIAKLASSLKEATDTATLDQVGEQAKKLLSDLEAQPKFPDALRANTRAIVTDYEKSKETISDLEARVQTFEEACTGKNIQWISKLQAQLRKDLQVKDQASTPLLNTVRASLLSRVDVAMAALPKALAPELVERINTIAQTTLSESDVAERLEHWVEWHKANPDHPFGMQYIALSHLGSGTFKDVMLAFNAAVKDQPHLSTRLAMGLLKEPSAELERENRMMGVFKGVDGFMQAHKVNDKGTLVEYCDGDGNQLFHELDLLPPDIRSKAKLSIMTQLLAAMNTMHSMGIVHRDLKPDNIFFKRGANPGEYTIKIGDYGTCVDRSDIEEMDQYRGGGTLGYLPPEHRVGWPQYQKDVEGRAAQIQAFYGAGGFKPFTNSKMDTYSMGLVLYELMIGPLPDRPGLPAVSRVGPEPQKKNADLMQFYRSRKSETPTVGVKEEPQKLDKGERTEVSEDEESSDVSDDEGSHVIANQTLKKEWVPAEEVGSKKTVVLSTKEDWFPEPTDKNSVEHGIWRMLQPYDTRASGQEVLAMTTSVDVGEKFKKASITKEIDQALKNQQFEYAAQRYLQHTMSGKVRDGVEVSKFIGDQFKAEKRGLLSKVPAGPQFHNVSEWNKAIIKAYQELSYADQRKYKLRVREGTNIIECYLRDSKMDELSASDKKTLEANKKSGGKSQTIKVASKLELGFSKEYLKDDLFH